MNETRTCHLCGTVTDTWCPTCIAEFPNRRGADEMTGEERMEEMRLWEGPLEIPFDMMHQRIEELVGRPVWTHEMGLAWDALVHEAGSREHPTMEQIIDLAAREKPTIVVVTGGEER